MFPSLPSMLKYTTYAAKNSLYNTPPCFAIYSVQLVLKWLEETIGGLERMAAINAAKAEILYTCIERSGFYRATAESGSRSLMNIAFRLPTEALEAKFVAEAAGHDLVNLKGHRSVGGIRASTYNAMPVEGVKTLVDFMREFARQNG